VHIKNHRAGATVYGWLFEASPGQPPHKNNVSCWWRKASLGEQVDGVTLHDLRHYCPSELIAAGCTMPTDRGAGVALWPAADAPDYTLKWDLSAGIFSWRRSARQRRRIRLTWETLSSALPCFAVRNRGRPSCDGPQTAQADVVEPKCCPGWCLRWPSASPRRPSIGKGRSVSGRSETPDRLRAPTWAARRRGRVRRWSAGMPRRAVRPLRGARCLPRRDAVTGR
jgi:hypothetical protein